MVSTMLLPDCPLCAEVNNPSLLIHEFANSYWVFGRSQFYPGYSLLLLKHHARELHLLAPEVQQGLFRELMLAGNAIAEVFKPWKMNYASYGNQVEHIHWHLIPRYETDPNHKECPFNSENAKQFEKFLADVDVLKRKIALLKQYI